uniref:Serine aminopeptidase S33 domain-containing protein n=1 Tax=Podarcis muralis TaxID=64176 RepID=A0A670K4A0_PODMU
MVWKLALQKLTNKLQVAQSLRQKDLFTAEWHSFNMHRVKNDFNELHELTPSVFAYSSANMAPSFLSRQGLPRLAYHRLPGCSPGVVFLLGFRSTRANPKCQRMEQFCRETGRAFVSFDYRGCGESDGCFEESRLGDWKEDTLSVFDELTSGPQVSIPQNGFHVFPRAGKEPLLMQWGFFEEAEQHSLLERPSIGVSCPVRLLHGLRDKTVPWQRALEVAERLQSANVHITLFKGGEHGLDKEEELSELVGAVRGLLALVAQEG